MKIHFRCADDNADWHSDYPEVPRRKEHIERGKKTLYQVKEVEWRGAIDGSLEEVCVWLKKLCSY